MSAAMLTMLSDLFYRFDAAVNRAAAADAALWSMVVYDYDGYVNMNYHDEHACSRAAYGRTAMRVLCASWLARACSYRIS